MGNLTPLQEVADDLAILCAIGEILEDVTTIGGDISAEAVSGIGTLLRRTAQRIRQAHAEVEMGQQS